MKRVYNFFVVLALCEYYLVRELTAYVIAAGKCIILAGATVAWWATRYTVGLTASLICRAMPDKEEWREVRREVFAIAHFMDRPVYPVYAMKCAIFEARKVVHKDGQDFENFCRRHKLLSVAVSANPNKETKTVA